MNQKTVLNLVQALVDEGSQVLGTRHRSTDEWTLGTEYVDYPSLVKWYTKCRTLTFVLGDAAEPWREILTPSSDAYPSVVEAYIAKLQGIREAIEGGYLQRIEDLVVAETFSDLLEQADYLLFEDYIFAAGVLGRAVLEQHLRNWCDRAGCSARKKATINDYNTALYTGKHIDKITMQHVTAMAAIGNDAAHARDTLKKEDVERLLRDVREFLVQHSM